MLHILEIVGMAAVLAGVAVLFWPAALIVGGALVVLVVEQRT